MSTCAGTSPTLARLTGASGTVMVLPAALGISAAAPMKSGASGVTNVGIIMAVFKPDNFLLAHTGIIFCARPYTRGPIREFFSRPTNFFSSSGGKS